MTQMKEQNKTLEKELNKMDISNLSDAEFKTLVIRMLRELSEDFSSIKTSVRNEGFTNKIKNNLQGINSTVGKAENQISNLEHKEAKITNQNSKKKKESKK